MTPAWILDVVAAVMLAVAAVSAARLLAGRPWRPGSVIIDADIAHLLMAIAMAGMLAPSLRTFPNIVWEVIFGALIAWFAFRVAGDARANGVRALAGGHCAPHLVHSGSMLYMFLAIAPVTGMAGMAGMSGMAGSSGTAMQMLRYPTLALAFALILIGYTIWDLDRLSGKPHSPASPRVSLAGFGAAGGTAMVGVGSVTAAFSASQSAGAADGFGRRSATAGAADSQAVHRGVGGVGAGGVGGEFLLSSAVTVGCRIAMGVAMAFLLLTAI
jgi:hypothetical protein